MEVEGRGLEIARSGAAAAEGMRMLRVGDKVYIDGTDEEGTVKEVHPHEAVVRVAIPGGHEERKYSHERLRLDPTMKEASHYIDH